MAFYMRLRIPYKNHPKAKQRRSWFGYEGRKGKKLNFSERFDLVAGICVVLPLNFYTIFAATNTTTIFKMIHIKMFLKKLVCDD